MKKNRAKGSKTRGIIAVMRQPRQWLHSLLNYITLVITWMTFCTFFRVERRGRHHVPRKGGALVISNHISWFDPPLLNVVLPGIPHWLAMAELIKEGFWQWFFINVGVIPVDRNSPGSAPLKEAVRRLRAGAVLVVFPEGGIRDGEKSVLGGNPELKEGAALIALKAGVPIVPAIIDGAWLSYNWRNWFFRRYTICLTLGEPFRLPDDCDRDRANGFMREKLLALANEVKCDANLPPAATEL